MKNFLSTCFRFFLAMIIIAGIFRMDGIVQPQVPTAQAAATAALTAGANAAVAGVGDGNGFEVAYGTNTPKDTTTSNDAGIESVNSGSSSSASCALPNAGSDQHDFSTFNVSLPAGVAVRGISVALEGHVDSATGTNTYCAFLSWDGGTSWTTGQNTTNLGATDAVKNLGSATDLWGRSGWTSTELNNTNFKVRVMTLSANANQRDFFLDLLTVTITYNVPPNSPSQDSPANSVTGVSVTPQFLMTATDAESDKLGYRVTIYSNSGCTTIVADKNQAVSATGWTGTNTSCTGAPTSCYTSGTQGVFKLQSADALSGTTQYWWKASAKDPDGSGSFATSTTCNTFTTGATPTISCSTNISSTSFGILSTSAIATSSSNASSTMSCTSDFGCSFYVHDQGNGSSPGLATSSPAYLIPSNTATLVAGTEGYGIQATSTAAGSGGTLTFSATYGGSKFNSNDVGALSRSDVLLASSTAAVTGREILVKHKAAISASTQSGTFADTITYSCLSN